MKFLIIHNRYRTLGGEESVVATQRALLEAAGHAVVVYERDYAEIAGHRGGRVWSFFTALRSPRAIRELRRIVDREKPDVALVHNLYPLISPSVLPILRRGGVRVCMMLHNFRLICPIGIFFRAGHLCEQCGQSRCLREVECLRHRCEGSLVGSFAYALRGAWGRKLGYFKRNVDTYFVLSAFQRDKLANYGIDRSKMRVLANPLYNLPPSSASREDFVGFVGRISVEKGVEVLFAVARLMPERRFKIVGVMDKSIDVANVPANVMLMGTMTRLELADFYSSAAVVVSCSVIYETFGLVLAEAMHYGAAVVVPRIASMSELVMNGAAGEIYTAGDATELACKIELLLRDDAHREQLVRTAQTHIRQLCDATHYAEQLTL